MDTSIDNLIQRNSDSIKSIDSLIQCVSDSIKEKNEEIANLKLEIKNSESVLETYEKRVRKLEEENKKLQNEDSWLKDKIVALENSNNAYTQVVIEALGEIPSSIDAFKEHINNRIQVAYNDGYGAAIGKMVAFVNKIKFDPADNTKQDQGTLKKALAADYGKCYFKVYKCATIRNKLNIIKALADIYNVPLGEVKSYIASLPVNGYGSVVLLDKVSDTTCKKLRETLMKVQIECDYFYT